jgi:hypothetical protein
LNTTIRFAVHGSLTGEIWIVLCVASKPVFFTRSSSIGQAREDEVLRACIKHGWEEKRITRFRWESQKGRDRYEDPEAGVRIILK